MSFTVLGLTVAITWTPLKKPAKPAAREDWAVVQRRMEAARERAFWLMYYGGFR